LAFVFEDVTLVLARSVALIVELQVKPVALLVKIKLGVACFEGLPTIVFQDSPNFRGGSLLALSSVGHSILLYNVAGATV
jgi:hypothetical protein